MGIVVTIAMLLGLVVLRPTPWRNNELVPSNHKFVVLVACFLLLAGVWNFAWYGLRHIASFWGAAALVSGGVMILSAVIVYTERIDTVKQNFIIPTWLRISTVFALVICFLLYAVTLIQLNLGYPILR